MAGGLGVACRGLWGTIYQPRESEQSWEADVIDLHDSSERHLQMRVEREPSDIMSCALLCNRTYLQPDESIKVL